MATMIERDLALLPKGHLHLHFEAAMRRTTLAELSAAAGITTADESVGSRFSEFTTIFYSLVAVLKLPGALRRVTIEAAEDARADGVVYLELAVSPQFYSEAYGSAESALAILIGAAAEAHTLTGVEVVFMMTFDRTEPLEDAVELAHLAARFAGRGVVSVGLANNELGYPAARLLPAFDIAREAGLLIAPHAGELLGAQSVIEALDVIGADRVQHGVCAVEDPELVARLANSDVCLDVCPTSNYILGIVNDLTDHPLRALIEAGISCSINADDPTIFSVSVLDEYITARTVLRLSDEQLAECARTSIHYSAASRSVRELALAGIDAWLVPPASTRFEGIE
jgi:adenosine deaminase